PEHLWGKPLETVVEYLAEVAARTGASVLVVDSLMAAMNMSAEEMKSDGGAPYRYQQALLRTGLTTISLGHTAAAAGNSSKAIPYGSVAWRNAACMAWNVTTVDRDTPGRYTLRLSQNKAN